VFAWLRPGDLIWNYWVNNYLLGKKPPAFDVLFWNADTTRMSARLHADFVDLAMDNKLVTPGALTVLGTPVDLSQVNADAYIVAGIADHITPWQNCYRSTQLLGGESRFILSTSGHRPWPGLRCSARSPSPSRCTAPTRSHSRPRPAGTAANG
jgi:polyhydroxyalkanoate synthase subunit PhaC